MSRFLEDPDCTQPISTSQDSLPLFGKAPASYHIDKNVILGTLALTPRQFTEQLLPKLPLKQDGAA